MIPSVIILTFNAEATIGATLASAALISNDVHVVDSGSIDSTRSIVAATEAMWWEHPFENYAAQRNWAIETLNLRSMWELHLDADERLSEKLVQEIKALPEEGTVDGYFIPRLVHFMGQPIRHGGMWPIWHMRLFRHGKGQCEQRRYDQHFLCYGPTAKLNGPMIDDIKMSLYEWIIRHNRWSEAEANEIEAQKLGETLYNQVVPRIKGNPIERKRALRHWYVAMPLFIRPLLLFLYRYVIRLGFLDGRAGLIFFVLQTLWFRFLIDAKLYERSLRNSSHDK